MFSAFNSFKGYVSYPAPFEERNLKNHTRPLKCVAEMIFGVLLLLGCSDPVNSYESNVPKVTLAPEAAQTIVHELTAQLPNCKLPCWFGIVLGETKWKETQDNLLNLGLISSLYDNRYAVVINTKSNEFFYTNSQLYTLKKDVVDMIYVETHTYRLDSSGRVTNMNETSLFPEHWRDYALSSLFQTLGKPADMSVKMTKSGYSLIIAYPSKGAVVEYKGGYTAMEGKTTICPAEANIALYLWNPSTQFNSTFEALSTISDVRIGYFEKEQYVTINQAFRIGIEEFYQLFLRGDVSTCIHILKER